jgi:hypothetical protein
MKKLLIIGFLLKIPIIFTPYYLVYPKKQVIIGFFLINIGII